MHADQDELVALDDIDARAPALLAEPYAYYARLRAEAPVYRDPKTGIVSVSTHALIGEVTRDPARFSSAFAHLLNSGGAGSLADEELAILAQGLPWRDTLLTADPPAHTRYRRIAMRAFTPARVAKMQEAIARTANELIDAFIADGAVEFKTQFADRLPSIVIADGLGVPRDDLEQFQIWLHAGINRLNGNADAAQRIDSAHKDIELQRYFLAAIADRREHPRDDIVSDLVQASLADEGGRPLDEAELYSILLQLFNAGQETSAHTMAYALYHLLLRPEDIGWVLADPKHVSSWIEEALRHLTPSHNMWRVVAQDTELGGVALKAGEPMLLRYGSGNRDPAQFSDPENFDIRREAGRHLAFGGGIHVCLGAALARKELNIAMPIVLQRLRNLRLADGPASLRMAPSPILRGVAALQLRFDPA